MAEVLVLIDHANGEVKKPAAEMLTIARRLGEPSAVFIGHGAETAKDLLARYGADKIYAVSDPAALEHLVAPGPRSSRSWSRRSSPLRCSSRATLPARRSVRVWPSRRSRVC